ncbi:DYW family of nucleic acid deaminases-domain-containing protein [Mariannaea sp. PMI_226]|nr:DYW family of nucleic acid deaminases-domain-containing protein [Mariannaea sp. PMI_226]
MAYLPKPKANVMWWDSSLMYIRCSHCEGIHRHGFDGQYDINHPRVPHCENHEHYTICFPPDGQYEIDKDRALYVRAGADPTEYFAEFNSVPEVDLSGRRKWTEAKEETNMPETTTSGVTALHIAACEMYPDMVRLLLDYGADPNARTVEGQTPLMEAALWGRLENVNHLLYFGADKSIQCMRAGKRLQAIDFARDTLENSNERHDQSGGEYQVYKEDTHERNKERRAIVRELDEEVANDELPGQTSTLSLQGFALTSIRDGRTIISMLAHFEVPNQYKTVGVLFRSGVINPSSFSPVAAMSGWRHQPDADLNVQIAGRSWINEVFQLSQITKYKLPADGKDQRVRGQFYACHAEKQLIAYFVSKHVFLPHEVDDGDFGMRNLNLDVSGTHRRGQETLKELQKIQPLSRLKEAVILVSRAVCPDCSGFVRKVNEELGLKIELRGANIYA